MLWACLVAAGCGEPRKVDRRPNLLVIVADDHGTDALGCYGNPEIRTPVLDGLAAEGVRFTQAFCTTASCSPSRSVILTGLQGHRNGMYGLQHQEHHFQSFDHVQSLPVLLGKAGYRTGRIGKFHVAPEAVYRFETVLSAGTANDAASIGRSPVEMAEQCRGFLALEDPRPFFLYWAVDDPHRSNTLFADGRPDFETYPEPNPFGNRPEGYPGIEPVKYAPERVLVPPFLPDLPETRAELAEYYQAVSRLDQGVGRLLGLLKETGHYDNTVIVYLSDNGVAFPGAKTTLYEPGIRLPLLVRLPGQPGGRVEEAMVTWADLTPTLLDYAGALQDEGGFDGRSFRGVLEGKAAGGWDEVYASHSMHEVTMYYPMRMVRTRKYKLIHNIASGLQYPLAMDLEYSPTLVAWRRTGARVYGQREMGAFLHRPEFELYDLQADPDEVVNLWESPEHRPVREELVAKLKAFQERTEDPWIHKWTYE